MLIRILLLLSISIVPGITLLAGDADLLARRPVVRHEVREDRRDDRQMDEGVYEMDGAEDMNEMMDDHEVHEEMEKIDRGDS